MSSLARSSEVVLTVPALTVVSVIVLSRLSVTPPLDPPPLRFVPAVTPVISPVFVVYPAPLVSWLLLVTLVAPVAIPSSFVLSAADIQPAAYVVAAGTVVLEPELETIVTSVADVPLPKFVGTFTCAPSATFIKVRTAAALPCLM